MCRSGWGIVPSTVGHRVCDRDDGRPDPGPDHGAPGPGVGAVVGGALVGSAVSMRVVEYNGVMHAAPPTYRASPELCLYAPYPVVCNRPNDERLILRKILEPLERE